MNSYWAYQKKTLFFFSHLIESYFILKLDDTCEGKSEINIRKLSSLVLFFLSIKDKSINRNIMIHSRAIENRKTL